MPKLRIWLSALLNFNEARSSVFTLLSEVKTLDLADCLSEARRKVEENIAAHESLRFPSVAYSRCCVIVTFRGIHLARLTVVFQTTNCRRSGVEIKLLVVVFWPPAEG